MATETTATKNWPWRNPAETEENENEPSRQVNPERLS
jgi:hypothetical protein